MVWWAVAVSAVAYAAGLLSHDPVTIRVTDDEGHQAGVTGTARPGSEVWVEIRGVDADRVIVWRDE